MDRRLLDYLPPVLREVLEFQTINAANEPEIAVAWDAAALLLANQFLETADENGVAVWERELKIYPKDTDTLEVRKARVKAKWNLELPYTMRWLQNWLTAQYGNLGRVTISYDLTKYTLIVRVPYKEQYDYSEALDLLSRVVPCNVILDWSLSQKLHTEHHLYAGFAVRVGRVIAVGCEIPAALDVTYLTDEAGDLLADEAGNRIIDEEA